MINPTQRGRFINKVRSAVTALLDAKETLNGCAAQVTAEDVLNVLTTDDFTGEDAGLLTAFSNIWTSVTALDGLFTTGHATNFYALKK